VVWGVVPLGAEATGRLRTVGASAAIGDEDGCPLWFGVMEARWDATLNWLIRRRIVAYVPVAEAAKKIRKALKEKGITSRQVSVRSSSYSMGSSIRVTIKDPSIKLAGVKEVAMGAESVRRCEYSGEILSGGNRYVNVCYSLEALKVMADKVRPQVAAAIAKIKGSYLIPVEGTPYFVGREQNGWGITVWGDAYIQSAYNENVAAEVIGRLMVQHS